MGSNLYRIGLRVLSANCLLYGILGIVAIAIGIMSYLRYSGIYENISYGELAWHANIFASAPGVLLFGGILILIATVCGCCGIKEENKYLLGIYRTALLFAIVSCGIIGILIFDSATSLEIVVTNTFEVMLQAYSTTPGPIDYIQREVKCCGVERFLDWSKDENWLNTISQLSWNGSLALPPSCCIDPSDVLVGVNLCDTASLHYQDGCAKLTWMLFNEHVLLFGSLGITIVLTACIGAIAVTSVLRRMPTRDCDSLEDATAIRRTTMTEPPPIVILQTTKKTMTSTQQKFIVQEQTMTPPMTLAQPTPMVQKQTIPTTYPVAIGEQGYSAV